MKVGKFTVIFEVKKLYYFFHVVKNFPQQIENT